MCTKKFHKNFLCVPTIYVLSKNMKIMKTFQPKIVIFIAVKNRCMLHGHVFVVHTKVILSLNLTQSKNGGNLVLALRKHAYAIHSDIYSCKNDNF